MPAGLYAICIQYNDAGPFTAASSERGGLSLSLGNNYESETGYVCLSVSVRTGGQDKTFHLETIRPGDRLKISYRLADERTESDIEKIEREARQEAPYQVPVGIRVGLDTQDPRGRQIRLSHPPDGEFGVVLLNVPLDHARTWVTAYNDLESWRWQLWDLYAGDSIEFLVVETDWNTPFPSVERTN
jgi:hypothetical protein